MIRTVIVDDHPVIRYGLRHLLEAEADIEVIAELASVDDARRLLAELRPDVVLLDLELDDASGVDALKVLRELDTELRIIIYTSHDAEERIVKAAELGVDGYLLKGSPRQQIVGAVRSVNDGGKAIEPAVAATLMRHMNRRAPHRAMAMIQFSRREQQVLKLLAAGKTNRDIGKRLCISESTVKFHVHAILHKLEATNRTEAVFMAVQQGLVSLAAGA